MVATTLSAPSLKRNMIDGREPSVIQSKVLFDPSVVVCRSGSHHASRAAGCLSQLLRPVRTTRCLISTARPRCPSDQFFIGVGQQQASSTPMGPEPHPGQSFLGGKKFPGEYVFETPRYISTSAFSPVHRRDQLHHFSPAASASRETLRNR